MTYKKKLSINFLVIFAIFALLVVMIQYNRERSYKINLIKSSLSAHTFTIRECLEDQQYSLEQIAKLLPPNLRITLIDSVGVVLFDNNARGISVTENHIDRPEVVAASKIGVGNTIRKSDTTGDEFYYLATDYGEYFIRVALPYDLNLREVMMAENLYVYFILALFLFSSIMLVFVSNKMGRSISAIRDFAVSLGNDQIDISNKSFNFPNDELGEIGEKLVDNYRQLKRRKAELRAEKDKLILHFTHTTVGIAFFSPEREVIYCNALFTTLLNTITQSTTSRIEDIFNLEEIVDLLSQFDQSQKRVAEQSIYKNGKSLLLRAIMFEDQSVEIVINDITQREKTRILKQQMTSNIAHELRTPISSVSGYLETLLERRNIPEEKRNLFLERSYLQVQRLSGLVRDISLITNLEERRAEIVKQRVDVLSVIVEVLQGLRSKAELHKTVIKNLIDRPIFVEANANLLYSIFRNLIDNAMNYSGEGSTIKINMFMEDENLYYFSVSDNGVGVDDQHLPKLFDRFYRISEGRSRVDGGSGLGLSIVKNAVKFHDGIATAKRSEEGGLEVIFSISKGKL